MENHPTKNEIRYKSKTNSALQFEQTNNRYCTNNKNKIENEKKTAPNNFFFQPTKFTNEKRNKPADEKFDENDTFGKFRGMANMRTANGGWKKVNLH